MEFIPQRTSGLLFWYLRLCLTKPFTCYILSYQEIILSLPLWTKSYHEVIQKIPYSIVLTIHQNFTTGNYQSFCGESPT